MRFPDPHKLRESEGSGFFSSRNVAAPNTYRGRCRKTQCHFNPISVASVLHKRILDIFESTLRIGTTIAVQHGQHRPAMICLRPNQHQDLHWSLLWNRWCDREHHLKTIMCHEIEDVSNASLSWWYAKGYFPNCVAWYDSSFRKKEKKGKKQVLYDSLGMLRPIIVEILLYPLLKIFIAGRILIKDWQQFSWKFIWMGSEILLGCRHCRFPLHHLYL